MKATDRTRKTRQPAVPPQTHGTDDCEWVLELLRQLADIDEVRLTIMSTLAVDDLWCIWRGTRHCATPRDQRTHQTAACELARRGLLSPAGQPQPASD